MVRSRISAAVALGLVLASAACGSSTGHVKKADVESQIKSQIGAKVGQTPEAASCPGNLEAKVGATERCTLTLAGTTYGTTVTVTDVHGSTVDFSINVDSTPVGGAAASSSESTSPAESSSSSS